MLEVGSRRRGQPAPPLVIFDALTNPNRDPSRPWLCLWDDEQHPQILAAEPRDLVVSVGHTT